MNKGKTLFSQIVSLAPKYECNKLVEKYSGEHYVKSISSWDQFLCMTFAQITHLESLRDLGDIFTL